MKIVHWNLSSKNCLVSGVKRYEDQLFSHVKALRKDIEIGRIQRIDNKIIGSVPISWLFRYKCKDADIVHATFQTIAPAAYFRRPRKFIVTVQDLIPLLYPGAIDDISVKLQFMFTLAALRKADRIIAISEFTKKEVIRLTGVDESVVEVVLHGVDHSEYHPMDKKACKQRLGLELNKKHILVVAADRVHKRMDLAKKVFDKVRAQRDDIKLIKTGYSQRLSGDDIISFGYLPESEMPILFNAADVFLHTSEYEGFCLPIVEAMSCGVPIVVSKKASIPEVVSSYGNMVDLGADDVLEQFVNKILSCIDKEIDEKAVEQSRNFSWQKTAEETIKVYETLI